MIRKDPKSLYMPRRRMPPVISIGTVVIDYERIELYRLEGNDVTVVMKSGYVLRVSGAEARQLWYALHGTTEERHKESAEFHEPHKWKED